MRWARSVIARHGRLQPNAESTRRPGEWLVAVGEYFPKMSANTKKHLLSGAQRHSCPTIHASWPRGRSWHAGHLQGSRLREMQANPTVKNLCGKVRNRNQVDRKPGASQVNRPLATKVDRERPRAENPAQSGARLRSRSHGSPAGSANQELQPGWEPRCRTHTRGKASRSTLVQWCESILGRCGRFLPVSVPSSTAIPSGAKPVTLVHYLVLIWLGLCGGIAGAVGFLVHGRDGIPIGMLVGPVVGLAILLIAQRLLVAGKSFRNRFPRCKTGRCTADDYRPTMREGQFAIVCECGDAYFLIKDDAGKTIGVNEVLPDGTTRPYMIRRNDEWVPAEPREPQPGARLGHAGPKGVS